MPAGFAVFSFGPIRPTDVPRLLVYVSRSRLTVRMGCCGTRMRSCGVCRRGSGGTFALGGTAWGASRCATEVRNDGKHNSDGAHTRGTTPWALRPSRQPIILHPRRGCAKRKPSRTISRPESHHSCTTSQTTSATGPRKRRFPNAPTRKRQTGRIEQHDRTAQQGDPAPHARRGRLPRRRQRAHARLRAHQIRDRERMEHAPLSRHVPAR